MPRPRPRPASRAQQMSSYTILAILTLIMVGLLIQQARFNPAVVAQLALPGGEKTPTGVAGQSASAGLVPTLPGFTPTGPVQHFQADNLSDKINGKAELYLSAGFQALAVQSFTLADPAGAYLEVFVYDMGKPENAYAVFSSQRRPGSTPLSFRANAYATANALFFTSGPFYVEMILDRAVTDVPAVVQDLLQALLANLPADATTSSPAEAFPAADLVADSVRLNAADVFGLEGFHQVFTAEYTIAGVRATAFLAQRSEAAQASAEAQRLQEFFLANGYQVVADSAIPPGITILAWGDSFEAIFVVGRTVAGVHDAPSLAVALELAQRLQTSLAAQP